MRSRSSHDPSRIAPVNTICRGREKEAVLVQSTDPDCIENNNYNLQHDVIGHLTLTQKGGREGGWVLSGAARRLFPGLFSSLSTARGKLFQESGAEEVVRFTCSRIQEQA